MRLPVSGLMRLNRIPAPVVARVVEGHRAGHEGEAQVTAPDRSRGHQAALSGRQALPLALGLAGLFGIGLVVFSRVLEPGDLVAERILETHQRILHSRRGAGLREPQPDAERPSAPQAPGSHSRR